MELLSWTEKATPASLESNILWGFARDYDTEVGKDYGIY